MKYEFKISNDRLILVGAFDGISGNVNTYICRFDITCDFDGLDWFCVFKKEGAVYSVPIIGSECVMPSEVVGNEGVCYIGVYGTNSGDDLKRISTNMICINIKEGAYEDGATPEVPSMDAWEMFVSERVSPILSQIDEAETVRNENETLRSKQEADREEKEQQRQENEMARTSRFDTAMAEASSATQNAENAAAKLLEDAENGKFDGEKGDPGTLETSPEVDARYLPNTTVSNVSPKITDAIAANVTDCQILGNSVREDDPSPENPVEPESLGDLVESGEYAGKYKVEARVYGKNLFNIDEVMPISVTESGGGIAKNADGSITITKGTGTGGNLIRDGGYENHFLYHFAPGLRVGETYTLSAITTSNVKQIYLGQAGITWVFGTSKVMTEEMLNSNIYWYFNNTSVAGDTVVISQMMIERSDTESDYEPYLEPNTAAVYLDEPLRKVGDYADYIDFKNQKLVRHINEEVIDGSYEWKQNITYSCFLSDSAKKTFVPGTGRAIKGFMINTDTPETNINSIQWSTASCNQLQIRWSLYGFTAETTIDEVQAYFDKRATNGTPLKIYYVLAEPIEEDIKINPIKLENGVNNIVLNTAVQPSNITVDYCQNPTLVINELKNAILALGGNI